MAMNRLWKVIVVVLLGVAIAAVMGAKSKPGARLAASSSPVAATPAPGQTAALQSTPTTELAPSPAAPHPTPEAARVPSPPATSDAAASRQKLEPQPQPAEASGSSTRVSAPRASKSQQLAAMSVPSPRALTGPTPAPRPAESPREKATPPSTPARRPQLIELGSKTCVPCKMMAPILEELRRDFGSQLEVLFYDIYERKDMAEAYQIRVIPTQVFLDAEGKEFFRHQGFYPKDDILAQFRAHGIALESK